MVKLIILEKKTKTKTNKQTNKKPDLALTANSMLYKLDNQDAKEKDFCTILLDTPSVAKASHRFYEKAGFRRIQNEALPFHYEYIDRNSYLYLLDITG